MSKSIVLSTLLLSGAGAFIWWQLAFSPRPISPSTPADAPSPPEPISQNQSSSWDRLTDPSIRWQVRVDRLRRLQGQSLTDAEIDRLYELLSYRPEAGHAEAWWVIVNEIMEQFRLQGIAPQRYSPALLDLLRDSTAPEVLRDYAVQHLSQWISPRANDFARPHETDPERITEALTTFADLAQDPALGHTTIPGTALQAIADMQSGGVLSTPVKATVTSLAPWFRATLAGENQVSRVTRISTINATGMLRLTAHHPIIQQLANDASTDPSLRLSSIAALGFLGQESDRPFLETTAAGNSKYRYAAQSALSRLAVKSN